MRLADHDLGTPKGEGERVSLVINGQRVEARSCDSILRAALQADIPIPKLCSTDFLEAFGSCRMCLVEVEGRKNPVSSCTEPVSEGLVVRTETQDLAQLRRGVMELYISDHPLDCLTCSANGDCELQDVAGQVGLREVRYQAVSSHTQEEKDASNPYFTYDPSNALSVPDAFVPAKTSKERLRSRLKVGGFSPASKRAQINSLTVIASRVEPVYKRAPRQR